MMYVLQNKDLYLYKINIVITCPGYYNQILYTKFCLLLLSSYEYNEMHIRQKSFPFGLCTKLIYIRTVLYIVSLHMLLKVHNIYALHSPELVSVS